jgi:DNA-binding NtrC family response regulator
MEPELKILLIEDNQNHAELITRSLKSSLPKSRTHHTLTHQECLSLLEKKRFDIILMDYYLNNTTAINLLREISRLHPEVPVIIVTGQGDERTAAKSIKSGAEDYVVKTRETLEALPKIITRAIEKHKKHKAARHKILVKKQQKNHRILSDLFNEFEIISRSLKSIYKEFTHPLKKRTPRELKKLPLLEKKMLEVKDVMRKLFLSGK